MKSIQSCNSIARYLRQWYTSNVLPQETKMISNRRQLWPKWWEGNAMVFDGVFCNVIFLATMFRKCCLFLHNAASEEVFVMILSIFAVFNGAQRCSIKFHIFRENAWCTNWSQQSPRRLWLTVSTSIWSLPGVKRNIIVLCPLSALPTPSSYASDIICIKAFSNRNGIRTWI